MGLDIIQCCWLAPTFLRHHDAASCLCWGKTLFGAKTQNTTGYSLFIFMARQPQLVQGSSLLRFLDHTLLDTPHSVRLLRTSCRPVAETSIWQHTTLTTDKHPCSLHDLNPQSQQASGRRPTPQTARLPEMAQSEQNKDIKVERRLDVCKYKNENVIVFWTEQGGISKMSQKACIQKTKKSFFPSFFLSYSYFLYLLIVGVVAPDHTQ